MTAQKSTSIMRADRRGDRYYTWCPVWQITSIMLLHAGCCNYGATCVRRPAGGPSIMVGRCGCMACATMCRLDDNICGDIMLGCASIVAE